jgi:glutamate-5-semialdehyde dehydrogenase
MTLEDEIVGVLKRARTAVHPMSLATTEQKNAMLTHLARALRANESAILAANASDLHRAEKDGRAGAFLERLTLNPARVAAMAKSVEQIMALPDPVGAVLEEFTRPNGLRIRKVRVPLGLIAIIYESRPNVTIDAGALGFKSGNAIVLRGGREALDANSRLADLIAVSLMHCGLNEDAVTLIRNPDREAIQIMKRRPDLIELIIPRGGNALKDALQDSSVPLLPHFDGLCHTYVDKAADLTMAAEICFNAKCSRPSVCNAMETMLVHAAIAEKFLPAIGERMIAAGVELRGDQRVCRILPQAHRASPVDFDTEYLDLILSIAIVDSLDEAITFIERHGSHLADAIVTADETAARRFEREVDSATVYVNASTRFTDGFEFGFGAETGISTNRLHARGPMGLKELTTYKYVIQGTGQVRNV